jgi:hypothetical protein
MTDDLKTDPLAEVERRIDELRINGPFAVLEQHINELRSLVQSIDDAALERLPAHERQLITETRRHLAEYDRAKERGGHA